MASVFRAWKVDNQSSHWHKHAALFTVIQFVAVQSALADIGVWCFEISKKSFKRCSTFRSGSCADIQKVLTARNRKDVIIFFAGLINIIASIWWCEVRNICSYFRVGSSKWNELSLIFALCSLLCFCLVSFSFLAGWRLSQAWGRISVFFLRIKPFLRPAITSCNSRTYVPLQ